MKKMNALTLAFTYAGCFFGAGYVSGQELLQFFGRFGISGFYGLALTILIQLIVAGALLLTAYKTKIFEMDRIIVPWRLPWLRTVFGVIMAVFMFAIATVMFAGFGALLAQLFGLPSIVGGLLLAIVVAVLAILGMRSVVTAFSVFVPILAVAAVILCIAALSKFGMPTLPAAEPHSGWAFSAADFVSYNILVSVGILSPLGQFVKSKKSIFGGVALGSISMAVVAAGLILSMYAFPASMGEELPMLAVASAMAPACGMVYAVLLFGGMLSTALSSIVAVEVYVCQRMPKVKQYRVPLILAMVALALSLSTAGFGNLVSTVYPIFGYVGFVALGLIMVHYVLTLRKK